MYSFTKLTQVIKATVAAAVVASAVFVVPGGAVHAEANMCGTPSSWNYAGKNSSHFVMRVGDTLEINPAFTGSVDYQMKLGQYQYTIGDGSILSGSPTTSINPASALLNLTALQEGTTTIAYWMRDCHTQSSHPQPPADGTATVTVLPATCYYIQSRLNGDVMDIAQAQMQEGQRIISYPWHSGQNQLWNFDRFGHLLSNQDIRFGLAVTGQNTSAVLTQNLDASNQYAQWGGPYAGYLQNKANTGIVLSVQGGNAATATPIVGAPQLMGAAQNSQYWTLVQAKPSQCHIEPAQ